MSGAFEMPSYDDPNFVNKEAESQTVRSIGADMFDETHAADRFPDTRIANWVGTDADAFRSFEVGAPPEIYPRLRRAFLSPGFTRGYPWRQVHGLNAKPKGAVDT